ncbi:Uma2 family endonuclease [Algoriphagus boritolerans]|uniref:Endonuclease, Uma2 family (Restriction endonuclease fold) n=1 Tax=Algoriphagus boritolerans DSM 17298 = JCM 18970 TaxID=1120964 RepID=A0A1H5WV10_9BACT|nr:Uma2 family endonuclease [Algoriphagus boritolerans]SEG03311.1 Endonuclease, Uma2 family (restriction endonuclease fold) [Algoriphagus boritolerans DSM 17298 = JCM 18970]
MKPYRIPQKDNIDLDTFQEPNDSFAGYTYADYLNWDFEEIVELIKGKIFAKAAAPSRKHQEVSIKLSSRLWNHLEKKSCKVYSAPFDVRFSKDPDFRKIDSVVQPDISVICDSSKLDERGCFGAPDLIVEILSPRNSKVELQNKFDLYQEFGVREYWIIHPAENTLQINVLVNGIYQPSRLFTSGQKVTSTVLPGFELELEDVFSED